MDALINARANGDLFRCRYQPFIFCGVCSGDYRHTKLHWARRTTPCHSYSQCTNAPVRKCPVHSAHYTVRIAQFIMHNAGKKDPTLSNRCFALHILSSCSTQRKGKTYTHAFSCTKEHTIEAIGGQSVGQVKSRASEFATGMTVN